jgi:hypothetical protein
VVKGKKESTRKTQERTREEKERSENEGPSCRIANGGG